jgi:hypothetical protein
MSKQLQVILHRTRDTKSMTRFDVPDGSGEDAPVTAVYVCRDALETLGKPTRITLTIAPDTVADAA